MPVYEFFCEICGPFEQRRDIGQASDPLDCPNCRTRARRVFSAPNLRRTTELQRLMLSRNEAGAEPRVERRPAPEEPAAPHAPHVDRDHRPWMVGH